MLQRRRRFDAVEVEINPVGPFNLVGPEFVIPLRLNDHPRDIAERPKADCFHAGRRRGQVGLSRPETGKDERKRSQRTSGEAKQVCPIKL